MSGNELASAIFNQRITRCMHPSSLETALDKIATYSKINEEENYSFRAYLKGQRGEKIDKLVKELNDKIASQIDCTKCGNCCRHLMVTVEDEAIERLSKRLNLSEAAFRKSFIEVTEENQVFNTIPCHFLEDSKCTVYAERPGTCREFPYLDKPGFTQRLFSIISHCSICPIVFNVVEALKKNSGFKNG